MAPASRIFVLVGALAVGAACNHAPRPRCGPIADSPPESIASAAALTGNSAPAFTPPEVVAYLRAIAGPILRRWSGSQNVSLEFAADANGCAIYARTLKPVPRDTRKLAILALASALPLPPPPSELVGQRLEMHFRIR